MGRLNDAAHSLGILGELGNGQRMPGGGQVGVIHGLIGLGLDGQPDLLVVLEHRIESLDQQFGGARSRLGFAQVGAFAGQPQHQDVGAQFVGDVDALSGTIDGVAAQLRIVAGVATVDGLRSEPQAGGDHLGHDALVVEALLQSLGF